MTIFVEPWCEEFVVPIAGEAIVRLEDGAPHSIDIDDAWVTIWDEGGGAIVEIVSVDDKRVDDALMLAQTWLHRFGAEQEAKLIGRTVDELEPVVGYFNARAKVFGAFHDGFVSEEHGRSVSQGSWEGRLAASYRIGVRAAQLNRAARENHTFPDLSAAAPLDTDTVRSAFTRALANGG